MILPALRQSLKNDLFSVIIINNDC